MFPVGRLAIAEQYAELLASAGVVRGLIGPRETPRLWTRHILNSAVLGELVPQGATVADVGSGAGLPGIPLAIARPDLEVTLIEPLLRRTTFLEEAVAQLALSNVTVIRARGEELHLDERVRPGFDVVTSRAVASLAKLLDWCMPLVAPTGSMVALKGAGASDEVVEASGGLSQWRCSAPEVLPVGVGVLSEPTHAIRVGWSDPPSVSWPVRRSGSRTGAGPARRRRSGR